MEPNLKPPYKDAIIKVMAGQMTLAAIRKVVSDPSIKLPIGFYKECRRMNIHIHVKRKYIDYNVERMFQ